MIKFKKKRTIMSLNIDVPAGSFAFDTEPLVFETCREKFGKLWNKDIKGFYMRHQKNEGVNVASFILKTEEVLGRKRFTRFAETNRDILWIEPSIFWRCCRMRRSLFTILVRCGRHYYLPHIDYEDALFSEPYTTLTRNAVMRFLFGYTKYVGPSLETSNSIEYLGWKSFFNGKSNDYLRRVLIWPGKNPHKLSKRWRRGNEFLWS